MSLSEFEIIQHYFKTAALMQNRSEVVLGIGDDGALLEIPDGHELAISTDVLVESVHFPSGASPEKIANRALAVNLSDLAAMGAKPLCFTLGLVLAEPTTIAIQVKGIVESGKALMRSTATAGESIYVTGTLGDGAIALASMGIDSHLGEGFRIEEGQASEQCRQYFEDAYFFPEPRIDFSRSCANFITSAIDISDGLVGDLAHICESSGVGALIETDKLPVSGSARCCVSNENLLRAALYGGDDYELCVTVAKENEEAFVSQAEKQGTGITRIGHIFEGDSVRLENSAGNSIALDQSAYQHFKD